MLKSFKRIIAVTCLTASFGAMAGSAGYGDHVIVSCSSLNLNVAAVTASYETTVTPGVSCATALKLVTGESMSPVDTSVVNNNIIYSFRYFSM